MSGLAAIDLATAQRFGAANPAAAAALALASWATRQGHTGLSLSAMQAGELDPLLHALRKRPPTPAAMLDALGEHRYVGSPETDRAFVEDHGLLYLRRVWQLETEAAARLLTLANRHFESALDPHEAHLDKLLPPSPGNEPARAALRHAARSGLTVLTGGPGTGKTWSAARLLGYLQALSPRTLRVAAVAPTGKAAARLGASLREQQVAISAPVIGAQTLHRLLGVQPQRAQPRFGAERPLPIDILLLDEASMLDLPMLVHVLRALPERARLILLGDPDQLPALGGGRVLADLLAVQSATAGVPIQRIAHALTRSHRFATDAPVMRLLLAVRMGEGDDAVGTLENGQTTLQAEWDDIDPTSRRWQQVWREGFQGLRDPSIERRLAALLQFRVLCAGNEGRRGVAGVNRAAEVACLGKRPPGLHYDGQPILIRENAPALDLWNGDLGVIAADPLLGLRAWFVDGSGLPRALRVDALPAHDTAYAMSVHKAQGSEFTQVVLLLPAADSPLLTREWLYTGLSRSRESMTVCGAVNAFKAAIGRREQRWSRLAERLLAG
ncbi:MAG: exodeoxyribonuclease V subunit alpha [Pseudomarimonas sp.]